MKKKMRGGHSEIRVEAIGLKPFSPYAHGFFYCPLCCEWVHESRVELDRRGRPLCPKCRHNLRVHGRKPSRWSK